MLDIRLRPFRHTLTVLFQRHHYVSTAKAGRHQPLTNHTFGHMINHNGHRSRQVQQANIPAPVTRHIRFENGVLYLRVFRTSPIDATPIRPMVNIIRFSTGITRRPTPHRIFTKVTNGTNLNRILYRVRHRLLSG